MKQSNRLAININELLNGKTVESDRLEFKSGWNPASILRSICGFANDFHNYGGGYIIIGIEEFDGKPKLPPKGIELNEIDFIQRDLLRICHIIQPIYFPILSIENYMEKTLIVLWIFGGSQRPYKAPRDCQIREKQYEYYIRRYSSTVIPTQKELEELLSISTQIPFDDRIYQNAEPEDLKLELIQSFLSEVKSNLFEESSKIPFRQLCKQIALVDGSEEYLKPRNVALLFFNETPDLFFPYSQIDVVYFPQGSSGDSFTEKIFKGPLSKMVRDVLQYINTNFIQEIIIKRSHKAEADRAFNYPFAALEEAIVNAVYHRAYDIREPIEIRIEEDNITILSYPGPDPSVSLTDLSKGRVISRRYRNRRIGEFLKELSLTEGRGTGLPKIRKEALKNGSPTPEFLTDENRSYFMVKIPIHPLAIEINKKNEVKIPNQQISYQYDGGHDRGHDRGHDHKLTENMIKILTLLKDSPLSGAEISKKMERTGRTGSLRMLIYKLLEIGYIELTIPEKPKSKNQKYRITGKGMNTI